MPFLGLESTEGSRQETGPKQRTALEQEMSALVPKPVFHWEHLPVGMSAINHSCQSPIWEQIGGEENGC